MNVYLSDEISQTLLEMPESGLVHMIRNNKIKEMQVLYNMFTRRNDSFKILRDNISGYIIAEGSKLVNDDKLKNEDLVQKLITLNK